MMPSQSNRTGLCLLGATGSIGASTLDIVRRHPDRYRLVAATANRGVDSMQAVCREFSPDYAVMADPAAAEQLRSALSHQGLSTEVLSGVDALEFVVSLEKVDSVMAAIVGAAGLAPTLQAVRSGKRVLLANKEALVMSGHLFMEEVTRSGAELIPVDSEHNAIFQCMPPGYRAGSRPAGVRRILLTASGGPFRSTSLEALEQISPDQACAHPNWDMGRKISVDSATMMNKGLELIEACWLFAQTPETVEVVVHPQSVIHSMVDYDDGSVLAQLGNPDMRTPIASALSWPERINSGVRPLDLLSVGRLEFERPDISRFPCLDIARQAWNAGGTSPAILNAANEIAVDAFLDHHLRFTGIPWLIEQVMTQCPAHVVDSLAQVIDDDRRARDQAREILLSDRRYAQ